MNKETSSGLEFHELAEEARETDNHTEALRLIGQALINYQKEKNYSGLSEAFQSRVLTYKHLFLLSKDKSFAIKAQEDAETSLSIAKEHDLSKIISSCYFRLGEVAMLFKDYKEAIKQYRLSLKYYHGTNAEKGDYRYHLGEALFRNGQKEEGKETMLKGLKEIQDNAKDVDPFLAHVWESGCHMKLAELLKEDDPEKAEEHLKQAKKIADSDEKLVIRKRQIEELSKKF